MGIYAERGNRVKRISESEIQKYVEQGYKITNGYGEVVRESIPMDLATLRADYKKQLDEIKALKAQNEFLTTELANAKAQLAIANKTDEVAEDATEAEEPKAPAKSKKALVIEEQPKQTKSKKAKVIESAPEAE